MVAVWVGVINVEQTYITCKKDLQTLLNGGCYNYIVYILASCPACALNWNKMSVFVLLLTDCYSTLFFCSKFEDSDDSSFCNIPILCLYEWELAALFDLMIHKNLRFKKKKKKNN